MSKIFPSILPLIAAAVMLAWPLASVAQTQSAVRSFDAETVEPGTTIEITVTANDYGQFGQIVEMLPQGLHSLTRPTMPKALKWMAASSRSRCCKTTQ